MKQMMVSPVKSFASEHGLKVLQPSNLKSQAFIEELASLEADLQVVVAFRMLPKQVWNMPKHGTMNLHGSLLPAYRGAAPIQWAVIRGETTTGLTTFLLQHEIDTGRIIAQLPVPILEEDDAGILHDRMMHLGAGLVLGSVDLIQTGQVKLTPQDEWMVSHAPKIHHEDAHINWEESLVTVYNLVRGMAPFPGAWSVLDGAEVKILKSKPHSNQVNNPVGKLSIIGKKLIGQAMNGELEILELQPSGKKRMSGKEFMNGYKPRAGLMT